jgi:hypothetical protein
MQPLGVVESSAQLQPSCSAMLADLGSGADFFDPGLAALLLYLLSAGCSEAALLQDASQLPEGDGMSHLAGALSGSLNFYVRLPATCCATPTPVL